MGQRLFKITAVERERESDEDGALFTGRRGGMARYIYILRAAHLTLLPLSSAHSPSPTLGLITQPSPCLLGDSRAGWSPSCACLSFPPRSAVQVTHGCSAMVHGSNPRRSRHARARPGVWVPEWAARTAWAHVRLHVSTSSWSPWDGHGAWVSDPEWCWRNRAYSHAAIPR